LSMLLELCNGSFLWSMIACATSDINRNLKRNKRNVCLASSPCLAKRKLNFLWSMIALFGVFIQQKGKPWAEFQRKSCSVLVLVCKHA
jgi:hypothetical protein